MLDYWRSLAARPDSVCCAHTRLPFFCALVQLDDSFGVVYDQADTSLCYGSSVCSIDSSKAKAAHLKSVPVPAYQFTNPPPPFLIKIMTIPHCTYPGAGAT